MAEPTEREREKSGATTDDVAAAAQNKLVKEAAIAMLATKDLFEPVSAPDNSFARYGLVTAKGVAKLPEGVWNATVHSVTHPLETLQTFGAAAAMGAVLKTVLPEAGPAGKIAGVAIGAYFTYQAAKPIMEAYSDAGNAKTMIDLDNAAMKLGNAGGEFAVGTLIAAGGYKLGAGGAERILLTERMDRFADFKQAAWDGAFDKVSKAGTKIIDGLGIRKTAEPVKIASSVNLDPRFELREGTSRYIPSEKKAPAFGVLKGEVSPIAEMEATVMLKSKSSGLAMDRALKRIELGRAEYYSDAKFAEKFGASEQSLTEITKFAEQHKLTVAEADLRSGRVVLKGKAGDFSSAFQTRLQEYQTPSGSTFRAREGSLAVPDKIQRNIEGIFGLDDRPQARSYAISLAELEAKANKAKPPSPLVPENVAGKSAIPDVKRTIPETSRADAPKVDAPKVDAPKADTPKPNPQIPADAKKGYLPNEVADAYNFPTKNMGEGSSVAIIQLGGGMDLVNEAAFYKAHGLPEPKIKVISVGGVKTKTGVELAADREVSLDSQIVGAIAPKADQKVIFGPNSDKGFIDTITRGTFAEAGERPTTSISISWGAPEETWTKQGLTGMNQAFKKAALKGISIFAAAGDDGALDKAPSGRFNVDYPAADPHVTAAGGTRLEIGADGKIKSERVWNGSGATGGGVSEQFAVPEYQKGIEIPANANKTGKPGRGVPDISGNADPATGWRIRVNGVEDIIGGTSASAPMFAALDARLSGELGKSVGPWNPFLYKSGKANAPFYNDIIGGDNNGYPTVKGWDATTGWGSVNGQMMLEALKADRASAPATLRNAMRNLIPGANNFNNADTSGKPKS